VRKLIAWNVVTLDGYFEGAEPWAIDFHQLVWGKDLQELSESQLADAGLLLFGRKTYVGMADYWTKETDPDDATVTGGMNSLPKAVISNTLQSADWNNTTLLKGDAAERVRELKAQDGGTIYVFGSADLLASLLAAGLVDEYRLCIAPVLLGKGNPLFKTAEARTGLVLKSSKGLDNGGVLLFYGLKPA